MIAESIPSQLQSRLNELVNRGQPQPLFVETGSESVSIALARAQQMAQLAQGASTYNAHHPSVLLLLSQQQLASLTLLADRGACSKFTCLSESQSPKDDLSVLNDPSQVLVTTPQRAIDHLRRDNIFISHSKALVIACERDFVEEGSEEFLDDVRFILTKIGANTSVEWYCDDLSHLNRNPQDIVERAFIITLSDWKKPQFPIEIQVVSDRTVSSLTDVLYTTGAQKNILIWKDVKIWQKIHRTFLTISPSIEAIGLSFDHLKNLSIYQGEEPVTIITIDLSIGEILSSIHQLTDMTLMVGKIVCITTLLEAEELSKTKEISFMKQETKPAPTNQDIIAGKIQMIVAKVRIDSNPEELESLKKLFRKQVPFSLRGYFTAFLLREYLQRPKTSQAKAKSEEKGKPVTSPKVPVVKKSQEEPEKRAQEVSIPEGARTLYLNIGKMRRLYAKELSTILQEKLGITKEDIFSIRIHDKYSFITLQQEHAEKAIEVLNGIEIRGRVASVSYSNKE